MRSSKMASQQFHFFTRLPSELQMLIWKFHNANEPVVRHCFGLYKEGAVQEMTYAAFDEETRLFLDLTTAFTHHQLGSPVRAVVPLPAAVAVRSDLQPPYTAGKDYLALYKGTYYCKRRGDIDRPATHTLINFEKDILYFENNQRDSSGQSYLFDLIAHGLAPALPLASSHSQHDEPSHWIFSARKIAFKLEGISEAMIDKHINLLRSFRRLREVLLVHCQWKGIDQAFKSVKIFDVPDNSHGLIDVSRFLARKHQTASGKHSVQLVNKFKSVFAENHMEVCVKVVADLY
ncbi:hypothetical protein F5Y18DRAFT_410577 [Xylariaceae sp. FL1019]|nr:hypothetical protein F5Y18DRAFT_410577 [Xylariaceae sp. FL1019]